MRQVEEALARQVIYGGDLVTKPHELRAFLERESVAPYVWPKGRRWCWGGIRPAGNSSNPPVIRGSCRNEDGDSWSALS